MSCSSREDCFDLVQLDRIPRKVNGVTLLHGHRARERNDIRAIEHENLTMDSTSKVVMSDI
jgi:hypothetical protein